MIPLRFVLAVLLIGMGIAIFVQIVRVVGIRLEIVPGVFLALAILALGVHRMSLVLRAWKMTR
jgi:hypothetical protein